VSFLKKEPPLEGGAIRYAVQRERKRGNFCHLQENPRFTPPPVRLLEKWGGLSFWRGLAKILVCMGAGTWESRRDAGLGWAVRDSRKKWGKKCLWGEIICGHRANENKNAHSLKESFCVRKAYHACGQGGGGAAAGDSIGRATATLPLQGHARSSQKNCDFETQGSAGHALKRRNVLAC